MASKKHNASTLVDGMFMGAALLKSLTDEVVSAGGYVEQIHFLTTGRGAELLKSVAKHIATSQWRIPISLLQKKGREEGEEEYQEFNAYYQWSTYVDTKELGIVGELCFVSGDYDSDGLGREVLGSIPEEILEQLRKIKFCPKGPIVVTYNKEKYVINMEDSFRFNPGAVQDEKKEMPRWVALYPAEQFDLTR